MKKLFNLKMPEDARAEEQTRNWIQLWFSLFQSRLNLMMNFVPNPIDITIE